MGRSERPDSAWRARLDRRAVLGGSLWLGAGVGGVLASSWSRAAEHLLTHPATDADEPVSQSPYGGAFEPPRGVTARALDGLTRPPRFESVEPGRVRSVEIWASEQPIQVAQGHTLAAWTYNGTIPGPILRVVEGETLELRFRNLGMRPHNLHLHGRHAVSQDGWQPVAAGDETTYRIVASPFGVHPYHCHAVPVSQHVARGLYGTLIVDPVGGRPPAHEFVLVLCGFDVDGDGQNEIYAWNGIAGYFARFPIKVPVGELVRVYVVNMVSGDPVGSFHLHAETFDVYSSGTSQTPDAHTDVVTLGQAERAIVEFRLPERGRYMFHPHQIRMAERGAMGWFAAV